MDGMSESTDTMIVVGVIIFFHVMAQLWFAGLDQQHSTYSTPDLKSTLEESAFVFYV
jgi:hypothetical protein